MAAFITALTASAFILGVILLMEITMPLTAKGEKIRAAMHKQYGAKKGESVFYASINKGTIKGAEKPGQQSNPSTETPAHLGGHPTAHAAKHARGRW